MTYYQKKKLENQERATAVSEPIQLDIDTVHMWSTTLGDRIPAFKDASTYIRSRQLTNVEIVWDSEEAVVIKHSGTIKVFKKHE